MYENFPGVDFLRTALAFRERKRDSSSLVYVLSRARTVKKCTKKRDARAKFLFFVINFCFLDVLSVAVVVTVAKAPFYNSGNRVTCGEFCFRTYEGWPWPVTLEFTHWNLLLQTANCVSYNTQKLPFIESEQCRRFQLNTEISGKYVRPTLT